MTKKFEAIARREGKWWVVDVDGVGTTQGRTVREAEEMAADLVSAMCQLPVSEVIVDIEFRIGGAVGEEVAAARAAQQRASEATQDAAAKSRRAARKVLAAGVSRRDAARVLGVSPQRVSQLVPKGEVTG